jgi:hypothetical protein
MLEARDATVFERFQPPIWLDGFFVPKGRKLDSVRKILPMNCPKPLLVAGFLMALGVSPSAWGEITAADREAHPGMRAWEIDYDKPEDVKNVRLCLRYGYWDPKVEGDVSSGSDLQNMRIKAAPAHLAIKIFVGPKRSAIQVNDLPERTGGSGLALDSYAMASKPKPNYNGAYVLAQKAVPGVSAKMGDVQDAESWLELEIGLQP